MKIATEIPDFTIRSASRADAALILSFICEIAEYERLLHEVIVTEAMLEETLFGERPSAEALIGEMAGEPVCFTVFFHNFSTFMGRPGLYLEDLYVRPAWRGQGFGKTMLTYLAYLAKQRNCARFEWSVLDWNAPALKFYHALGAQAMDEWTVHRVTGEALDHLAQAGVWRVIEE
jgi:GNAT superfamily N-acetyltransferase